MTLEVLTHSKRRDFNNCRRYYFHKHVQNLTSRMAKAGRRRGTLFGDTIFDARAFYDKTGDDSPAAIAAVVQMSLQDALEELTAAGVDERELEVDCAKIWVMVTAYIERYGFESRREVEFYLPLVNPKTGRSSRRFQRGGKIDGVTLMGNKHVRIIEDKFVAQIRKASIEKLPLDAQMSEYVDAFLQKGWTAEVEYRHTRVPGKNPLPPKQFKTKDDYPGETIPEYIDRLRQDVEENPSAYFDVQYLNFPTILMDEYRLERWQEAQDIITAGKVGSWYKNTERCDDYGGCEFIPLCNQYEDAHALFIKQDANPELAREEGVTADAA